MAAILATEAPATLLAAAGNAPGRVIDVLELAEAEPAWRAFEPDAIVSPYSRYDWVAAFAQSVPGSDVHVAVLRDPSGQIELLLPFAVLSRFGLKVGATVGGKHTNYTVPLMRASTGSPKPEQLRAGLVEAGRRLGLDAFSFINVPATWDARPNPLTSGGRPSASPAFSLPLETTGEATFGRSMSGDARKKMRNKVRGLAKLGQVTFLEAATPGEAERILEAYFRQKSQRFQELGIADPFGRGAVQEALRRAAQGVEPAIELYALSVDGEIVATLGGAASRDRLSGMFLSFAEGPAARYSPGDLLVHRVIERQCERGRATFDLGVGDARYKRNVCDRLDDLVDVEVPVTARGALVCAALRVAGDAKRRLKASPRAMAAVASLRRRFATSAAA